MCLFTFLWIKQIRAVTLHVLVFGRKRRFVHKSKLDWDVHGSSGRYVRKRCKPLKVRRILINNQHFFSVSKITWRLVYPLVSSQLWEASIAKWNIMCTRNKNNWFLHQQKCQQYIQEGQPHRDNCMLLVYCKSMPSISSSGSCCALKILNVLFFCISVTWRPITKTTSSCLTWWKRCWITTLPSAWL